MHTSHYTIEGEEYTVHHNGDWSGEVIIVKPDRSEVRLPGLLLTLAGYDRALMDAISVLEQLPRPTS